jgi:dGTPase
MVAAGRVQSRFAENPFAGRGRLIAEPTSPTRGDFQRDRDRIIHSTAFRRLKDKTQVFVFDEGDHYRTRLTHTIEVSQIARALARSLGLDEDLAEALALAHDLGHPPFGHSGEDTLDECMRGFGGFDHNAQSLRLVTRLERRYAAFDGLNLTWETLEGLVKHNGPLATPDGLPLNTAKPIPVAIIEYSALNDLWLWSWPSAEAQVAAIADDIAYDAHDIDDGVRARLIVLDAMAGEVPLIADLLAEVDGAHPGIDPSRRSYEVVRRVITRFIEDVIGESLRRLDGVAGEGPEVVRRLGRSVVGFSEPMRIAEGELKRYLYKHFYRAERVVAVRRRADALMRRMFARYMDDERAMPESWRLDLSWGDETRRARRVCDFIAGMTERFALIEYERLFGETAELR